MEATWGPAGRNWWWRSFFSHMVWAGHRSNNLNVERLWGGYAEGLLIGLKWLLVNCKTAQDGKTGWEELLSLTWDIVSWLKENFEKLPNLTNMFSVEKTKLEDSRKPHLSVWQRSLREFISFSTAKHQLWSKFTLKCRWLCWAVFTNTTLQCHIIVGNSTYGLVDWSGSSLF